jgi:chloramphenicol-sensitive protein RarD
MSHGLCATFALYGLLRKVVAADAMTGLAVETALLLPFALGWLAWRTASGVPSFGSTHLETGLLVLAGIVSTTPLLLFTAAARKLAYSTLGMLQFLAPTLQFLIGVYYGERFTTAHAIAFPTIWIALALYVTALLRTPRLPQPPE